MSFLVITNGRQKSDQYNKQFRPVKVQPKDMQKDKERLQIHEHNKRYALNLISDARAKKYSVQDISGAISPKDLKTYIIQLEQLLNIFPNRSNDQDIARAEMFLKQARGLKIENLPDQAPITDTAKFIEKLACLIQEAKMKKAHEAHEAILEFRKNADK